MLRTDGRDQDFSESESGLSTRPPLKQALTKQETAVLTQIDRSQAEIIAFMQQLIRYKFKWLYFMLTKQETAVLNQMDQTQDAITAFLQQLVRYKTVCHLFGA